MRKLFVSIITLFICLNLFSTGIFNLTVEMQNAPLAIETSTPRFGWQLSSDEPNAYQAAYQVIVTNGEVKVWDSGKVKSSDSQLVPYKGKALDSKIRYTWKVKVWDGKGKMTESNSSFFEIAPQLLPSDIQWIGAISHEDAQLPVGRRDLHSPSFKKPEHKALFDKIDPLALKSINLRKTFNAEKKVDRAIVHISGLGHYNLYINGSRVSKDIFTPVWSDYDKTVYYNTYQVDSLLTNGENAIGVTLGNGFYNAVGSRYRKLWISFGPPTLFFKMHVYYTDGSVDVISSDNTWKYALSPITFNDIYGGEDYDARLEQKGWNAPRFDDKTWKPVVIQDAPKGELRAQQVTSVRSMKQYSPVKMTKIDSSYVLDMGQNLSGFPSIKVKGKAGQTVTIKVGELLSPEGLVSQKQSGGPYTYSYTLKGDGIESWNPEFTYYGFQYIQVDGANILAYSNDLPTIVDIQSHFIYNSVADNGYFESSNEIYSRAHVLIKNAVRSNMQSVFTDCPHREKLGWLEETHLNGPGLLYNWDLTLMFDKVMQGIKDGQLENGFVPNIIPEYVVFGEDLKVFRDSPEWGGAAVMVPWMYYQFYGDQSIFTKYYDVMKRYVDYLTTTADNHIVSHGLGDWYDYGEHRAGFSKNSPVAVSATAHYYYYVCTFSQIAKLLNNKADQKKYNALAAEIKQAFNQNFFDTATKQYGSGSQFCNAIAIFLDLAEPQYKQAVMDNLKKDIADRGYRLTTGDVGNRYLFQALALNGENEVMNLMNNHYDAPGYGFQIKYGVTTLTEQWDPRKGASWNHFMMGQIDEWFFHSLAGIVPTTPGFKEFTIQPQLVSDLTWVKAGHKTLYGDINVEWEHKDGKFTLSVLVPVNTKATVILPNGKKQTVGSGKHKFECNI